VLGLGVAVATGSSPSAQSVFAARSTAAPTLEVSVGGAALRTTGSALTVSGKNFTPSAGGQQVYLWVGYPDDYCSADKSVCHGFYAYPWVEADGTFSVTYTNVLLQSGTGTVSASQWNTKNNKWVKVDSVSYTAP